jgi:hypothetical protein
MSTVEDLIVFMKEESEAARAALSLQHTAMLQLQREDLEEKRKERKARQLERETDLEAIRLKVRLAELEANKRV